MNEMKLSEVKKVIERLDECDKAYFLIEANQYGLSQSMINTLLGSVIERKVGLMAQLARVGIKV